MSTLTHTSKDDHVNSSRGHEGEGYIFAEQSDLPLDRAIYILRMEGRLYETVVTSL